MHRLLPFPKKKNWKKNVTLDPRHGTLALDMKPSTLDPRQKDRLSFTWSQNSPMILCRLLDCWLISNNLQDSVLVTNILPAIKTDHAAISLDFNISQKHIKGSGYWKMNCFLLDDDNYQMEVTAKMPVWLAQGRGCDLPDHRCIWDWIKHNLRAHAIQFSKRKAKQKKIRRTYCKMNLTMQSKTSNAILPIKMQVNAPKEKLEHFYEEKLQGLIRARA